MADTRDISGKNRKFTGTSGIILPSGTEAQRTGSTGGEIRFNTDTNLAEYYDGTEWKPIDAPPTLTNVSPANPVDDGVTTTTITITGSNLQSGGTLKIIGNDGTEYPVSSFTRVSSGSLTFTYTSSLAAAGVNTPYDIKYENPSGLAATLEDGFAPNTAPTWVSPGDGTSLGTININTNSSNLTQISVTDTTGGTLVYSVSSGALPTGANIDSATGAISGVVNSAGTFNFTIQVTDGTTTISRSFSATVVDPWLSATGGDTVITSGDYKTHVFTSPGTFTVTNAGSPTGSNSVEYLVVAGGAGGAGAHGGGGGAGGYRTNYPSPATGGLSVSSTNYPVQVGGGGSGRTPAPGSNTNPIGGNGGNSVFSTITSTGGGGGAYSESNNRPGANANPGGSGGGGGHGTSGGGTGNSPPVSPPQGNNGGGGYSGPVYPGGGAGGAGAAGTTPPNSSSPAGTSGIGAPISTTFFGPSAPSYGTPGPAPGRYFAGGGGGGVHQGTGYSPGTAGGGGRGGTNGPATPGVSGTANTGGGGGGTSGGSVSGSGGSGIVAIRYKFQ